MTRRRGGYGHELWHAGDDTPSVILTGGPGRPIEAEPLLWEGDQA